MINGMFENIASYYFLAVQLRQLLMFFIGAQFNIFVQVAIYSLILFFACMLCHGELARLKPNNNKLTSFYLVMALGGVMGSIFTSVVAEHVFTQYYEFSGRCSDSLFYFFLALYGKKISIISLAEK